MASRSPFLCEKAWDGQRRLDCSLSPNSYGIRVIPRRVILAASAFVLLVVDGLWFYKRFFAPNATILYVGADSFALTVPMKMRASKLLGGKWDSDPLRFRSVQIEFGMGLQRHSLALVSLEPEGNYGKAVEVLRDLKKRHICNVLIREVGRAESERVIIDFADGPDRALTIQAIALCGNGIGDAGFSGTLPKDGPIHINMP
jgi:hypothetical protein